MWFFGKREHRKSCDLLNFKLLRIINIMATCSIMFLAGCISGDEMINIKHYCARGWQHCLCCRLIGPLQLILIDSVHNRWKISCCWSGWKVGILFMLIACLVETAELTCSRIDHCFDSYAHSVEAFCSHYANSIGEVKSAMFSYSWRISKQCHDLNTQSWLNKPLFWI